MRISDWSSDVCSSDLSAMPSDSIIAPGEVWLVGAGPGDPELLTRRAERLIREAEVIFHDALVGPGILELAGQGADRKSVVSGKSVSVRVDLGGRRIIKKKRRVRNKHKQYV